MSIDLSENLIQFPDAPKHIPGRPHISTCFRWKDRGIGGIRLETIKVAGKRFTSLEAIQRFIARTTAVADGEAPPIRTSQQRERDINNAERELDGAGI